MQKIEKLTKFQEQRLVEFRQEWLDIGLCCEPAKFDEAEKHITFFYEKLGKKKPIFFRFSSPMMCELGTAALKILLKKEKSDQLWGQLSGQLWGQLSDQLRGQLSGQLRGQLSGQLSDQLSGQLSDQLRGQLSDQLRGQLSDQLSDQLSGQLSDQLRGQLSVTDFYNNCFLGQHESYWIAFYKFAKEIGVKYENKEIELLNAWGALAASACWWSPWEGICIISDRPKSVSFDSSRRLHNEERKAVEFRDGWGVSAWHGIRIPDWIVENPEQITLKKIDSEENAELRRIMLTKYGMAKYLEERGAKEIDRDRDTKGERILFDLKDKMGNIKLIKLENSTPERDGSKKWYTFRVDPTVKTCQEAVAYLYSMEPDRYRPVIEC